MKIRKKMKILEVGLTLLNIRFVKFTIFIEFTTLINESNFIKALF